MIIYKIINSANDHIYVGSETVPGSRWKTHLWRLRRGSHHSRYLQRAYCKYGESAFSFCQIEGGIASNAALIEREQYYIDTLKPQYNMCPRAGSSSGIKLTEGHKKAISDGLKKALAEGRWVIRRRIGFKHTDSTKQRMAASSRGKKLSAEACEKIRIARTGTTASEEAKEKNRLAQLGKKRSEEAKARMRESCRLRGPRSKASSVTKQRMAEAHRARWAALKAQGFKFSIEARANMREAAFKRSPPSAETCFKMSLSKMGNKINKSRTLSQAHKDLLNAGLFRHRAEKRLLRAAS